MVGKVGSEVSCVREFSFAKCKGKYGHIRDLSTASDGKGAGAPFRQAVDKFPNTCPIKHSFDRAVSRELGRDLHSPTEIFFSWGCGGSLPDTSLPSLLDLRSKRLEEGSVCNSTADDGNSKYNFNFQSDAVEGSRQTPLAG